jgi:sugar lactone lactonase YvrE
MDTKLGPGLNALTFDRSGNVYVSDSFNGVILKTGPGAGSPTQWSTGPLLGPGKGVTPRFGANGVEFDNAGNNMYVANTAFHQIIKIPVNSDGTAARRRSFSPVLRPGRNRDQPRRQLVGLRQSGRRDRCH